MEPPNKQRRYDSPASNSAGTCSLTFLVPDLTPMSASCQRDTLAQISGARISIDRLHQSTEFAIYVRGAPDSIGRVVEHIAKMNENTSSSGKSFLKLMIPTAMMALLSAGDNLGSSTAT